MFGLWCSVDGKWTPTHVDAWMPTQVDYVLGGRQRGRCVDAMGGRHVDGTWGGQFRNQIGKLTEMS